MNSLLTDSGADTLVHLRDKLEEIETELFNLEDSDEIPKSVRDYLVMTIDSINDVLQDYRENR
jgi:hypothetical protein